MSRNHDRHGQHVYGTVHKKERNRWVRRVQAGGVVCWRCGNPIPAGAKWDLGHVDEDGQARGWPPRHPEHPSCNRATMTHLKEKLAASNGVARERPRASATDRFGGLPDPDPRNTFTRWSRHWSGPFNPRCPECRRTGEPCEVAQRFEAGAA